MRGTWFVRFWEQCKTHVKSKDNSKRWPGRKSYLLNSLKDPTSRTSSWETLRSTARSMKLCWALLSQFEWIWADMSWIFEVKSRHMQNADRLWMLVSGFAAKRNYSIFSIADQDFGTACEARINASLADGQRFPSPQTSPDAQCSWGPIGQDPGAGGLFDNPAWPARWGSREGHSTGAGDASLHSLVHVS